MIYYYNIREHSVLVWCELY